MHPWFAERYSRRALLQGPLATAGTLALASLLGPDRPSLAAPAGPPSARLDVAASQLPHFAPRAQSLIYIYLEGGPSQIDLFDPKPRLNSLHGQPLPESLFGDVRFAFLDKATARLMGSPRTFRPHGQCGMELSDLLPYLARRADDLCLIRSMQSDQFNHMPGQLLMNTGSPLAGRPSVGAWLNYGLGSETENLPAYVALVTAGRGIPGGSASWSSGFLPSSYSGTLFRSEGDPILHLSNPPGIRPRTQAATIEALADLNRLRLAEVHDPELESRIASYELAFRMQSAAPELVDLSRETQATLDLYGLDRYEPPISSNRGGVGLFGAFSRNCLLARRLVERGVRVVSLMHASWDHHSRLDGELPHNAMLVDQPIAALLEDLRQRGLLDTTLVVWSSEFGRTPLGQGTAGKAPTGRDHHPHAFSVWMAGGGTQGGRIIGQTDDFSWNVVRDGVHVHDLHATILHLFGIDHTRLTYRHQGRDFRLTDVAGHVVEQVFA